MDLGETVGKFCFLQCSPTDLETGPDHLSVELYPYRNKNETEEIEWVWQYDGNYMKVELFSFDRGDPVREEPDPGGTMSGLNRRIKKKQARWSSLCAGERRGSWGARNR